MTCSDRNLEDHVTKPQFAGALVHRGTLAAKTTHDLETCIWVQQPALLNLRGWQLDVETGDEIEGQWIPRMTWSRIVSGGSIEIMQDAG